VNQLSNLNWHDLIYAAVFIISGFILAKILANSIAKLASKRFTKHKSMIIRKFSYYLLLLLFIISALQQLGFELGVLLGAAGIFTLAISFASQTAISNLISGVFLLFEHPFKVGDIIQAKGFTGVVESIDLLSTKIKTFDNQLIRLPNEGLIKSEIANLSYFTTRRCDLVIGVGYATELEKAKSILLEEAASSELALDTPPAKATIDELADSAINIKLSVWVKTENLGALKSELQQKIKARLQNEEIDIPYPHISISKE
jgi:small conductance mechanosensitive channel